MPPETLFTVPKAAKLIGRHKMTLYRWIEAGKIESVNFSGILFVPFSEIERYRLKLCKTCYHHANSHCACREDCDRVNPCNDWHPKE